MKELKKKAHGLNHILTIGKSGLTEPVIKEVKKKLKQKKLIKIKFLKSALDKKDKKELFKELAEKTNSKIIHKVGFVVVLYKK